MVTSGSPSTPEVGMGRHCSQITPPQSPPVRLSISTQSHPKQREHRVTTTPTGVVSLSLLEHHSVWRVGTGCGHHQEERPQSSLDHPVDMNVEMDRYLTIVLFGRFCFPSLFWVSEVCKSLGLNFPLVNSLVLGSFE